MFLLKTKRPVPENRPFERGACKHQKHSHERRDQGRQIRSTMTRPIAGAMSRELVHSGRLWLVAPQSTPGNCSGLAMSTSCSSAAQIHQYAGPHNHQIEQRITIDGMLETVREGIVKAAGAFEIFSNNSHRMDLSTSQMRAISMDLFTLLYE